MVIHDRTIYVLGNPNLPQSLARICCGIEADPEATSPATEPRNEEKALSPLIYTLLAANVLGKGNNRSVRWRDSLPLTSAGQLSIRGTILFTIGRAADRP